MTFGQFIAKLMLAEILKRDCTPAQAIMRIIDLYARNHRIESLENWKTIEAWLGIADCSEEERIRVFDSFVQS